MHVNACALMGCLIPPLCGGVGDSSTEHNRVHRHTQPRTSAVLREPTATTTAGDPSMLPSRFRPRPRLRRPDV